jgi:bacterioferritin-associated ferredoxin
MKPEDKVCICNDVTLRKLVNYIRRERPPVPSLVSQCLSAGTACGWCVPFLQRLHREVLAGKYDSLDELDADAYERLRDDWLQRDRPPRDESGFANDLLKPG